jgi:aspartokinase
MPLVTTPSVVGQAAGLSKVRQAGGLSHNSRGNAVGVVVQKFGGSSVKNAESVMEAARKAIRAKHAGNKVIVVVSAQGSTTDDLIAKAAEITGTPSAREMDMLLATGEQISSR